MQRATGMGGTRSDAGRWLLRRPPAEARFLLFAFPYAGVGASSYRRWPQTIGDAHVCPLQPPGREHRLREAPHRTHAAFAADLADYMAGLGDVPFAFIGHCGAVPFALQTTLELEARGQALPTRLLASSWGGPHRGLYGRLNFVDLDRIDLAQEVRDFFALMGAPIREDFVELAVDVLRLDLEVQRPYRYDASRFLPRPVTVISWSRDAVVPPEQVHQGWEECAEVRHEELDGEHLDFLACPPALAALIERELGR